MKQIISIVLFLFIGMNAQAEVEKLDSASYAYGDAIIRSILEAQDSIDVEFEFNQENLAEFICGFEENLPNVKYTQDSIKMISFAFGVQLGIFLSDGIQYQIDVIPFDCIVAGLMKVVNHELTLPQDTIGIMDFVGEYPEDMNPVDFPEEDKCRYFTVYGILKGLQPGLQNYICEMTGKSEDEAPADYEAYAAGYAMVMKSLSLSGKEESERGPYVVGFDFGNSFIMEPLREPLRLNITVVDFLDGCRAAVGLNERKMTIEESEQVLSSFFPDGDESILIQVKDIY